jgi:hypothetical protein
MKTVEDLGKRSLTAEQAEAQKKQGERMEVIYDGGFRSSSPVPASLNDWLKNESMSIGSKKE